MAFEAIRMPIQTVKLDSQFTCVGTGQWLRCVVHIMGCLHAFDVQSVKVYKRVRCV